MEALVEQQPKSELKVINRKISKFSISNYSNKLNNLVLDSGLAFDLLFTVASKVQKKDKAYEEFATGLVRYTVDINELKELKKIKSKSLSGKKGTLMNAVKKLQGTVIELDYGDGNIYSGSIFGECLYVSNENKIIISIYQNLIPFISAIGFDQYTQLQLQYFVPLKSIYSKRLYMLLSQYRSTGIINMSIEKLRVLMGCEDKYKEYKYLKKKVIKPAIDEIIKKTNIESIHLSEKKTGKSVTSIAFSFNRNFGRMAPKEGAITLFQNETYVKLIEIGVEGHVAELTILQLGVEDCLVAYNLLKKAAKINAIEDYSAYYLKICQNKFNYHWVS